MNSDNQRKYEVVGPVEGTFLNIFAWIECCPEFATIFIFPSFIQKQEKIFHFELN